MNSLRHSASSSLLASFFVSAAALVGCASEAASPTQPSPAAATARDVVDAECNRRMRCVSADDASIVQGAGIGGYLLAIPDVDALGRCSEPARVLAAARLETEAKLPGVGALDFGAMKLAFEAATCHDTAIDPYARGTLAAASPCSAGRQCESGVCTITGPGCGTCAAKVAPGAACQRFDDSPPCVDGYACSTRGRCEVAQESLEGKACQSTFDCWTQTGLTCVSGTCQYAPCHAGETCGEGQRCLGGYRAENAGSSSCVARKTSGPCERSAECETLAGYACSATTHQCERVAEPVVVVNAGGDCATQLDALTHTCASGLRCSRNLRCETEPTGCGAP